jgi:hypothetical protein
MRLTVNIETDCGGIPEGRGEDVALALEQLAQDASIGGVRSGPLRDVNGNTIGRYAFEISLEPEGEED